MTEPRGSGPFLEGPWVSGSVGRGRARTHRPTDPLTQSNETPGRPACRQWWHRFTHAGQCALEWSRRQTRFLGESVGQWVPGSVGPWVGARPHGPTDPKQRFARGK